MSLKKKLVRREMKELRKLGITEITEVSTPTVHHTIFHFGDEQLSASVEHMPNEHFSTLSAYHQILRCIKSMRTEKDLTFGHFLLRTKKAWRYYEP